MHVFVAGCIHGKLRLLYETVAEYERTNSVTIELVLCCGDFQAVRNWQDLSCVSCPPKYRQLNDFYLYYRGDLVAPKLTIFVGGNHEASNYLQELPLGGWVAPNIFYLGVAGVIRVCNLTIGGISGIFKEQDFHKQHYERPPYWRGDIHSVYHVREIDIFRLALFPEKLDIFLSHDWPEGIVEYGNKELLLKKKPFFKKDLEEGKLGNAATKHLLFQLQPRYWFCAHMHCYFEATLKFDEHATCDFYALDKCLPKRPFYKVLRFPETVKDQRYFEVIMDPNWCEILKETLFLSQSSRNLLLPESWVEMKAYRAQRAILEFPLIEFGPFYRTAEYLSMEEEKMNWKRNNVDRPTTLPRNPQTEYISAQYHFPISAPIFCNYAPPCFKSDTEGDPNEILLSEDEPS